MKRIITVAGLLVCVVLASAYIYPIFSGLILLPLDLLVSNSSPWHMAATILLKNPYMQDSILQMFPWKHLTFVSLTSGIIPLWNPYQFTGIPFMALMKPLVYYPANIFFIFGEATAWNILMWIQLFLSLWFMILFLESCGLGLGFGIFGGVSFAFSSLMVSVLEFGSEGHVLLWLPFLLYLVKKYLDTQKSWYTAGIALSVAASIFAGHLQYFAYLSLVTTGFIVYYGRAKQLSRNTILLPLLWMFGGCVIAAVQLIPGIEMYQNSYRRIYDSYTLFSGGLLKPYHLLRLLSPDWFGNPVSMDLRGGYIELSGYFGIIPLFFALYGAIYYRNNIFVRFLSFIAALALLFSLDGIAQILYSLRIPVIASGYGGRLFSMFLFSGSSLSAFGLNAFIRDKDTKRKTRVLIGYVALTAFCFIGGIVIGRWNTIFGVRLANIKIQVVALFCFYDCNTRLYPLRV